MWSRASSLQEAVSLAEEMKTSGKASWFRGQTRTWPMLSSYARRGPGEQRAAVERMRSFLGWVRGVPALAELASDDDSVLAVAQHYGLPTNLIDFTTEPAVAAFFASHDPPPPQGDEDVSCIVCLDWDELKDVCDSVKIVRPDMPEPRVISLDIPDLWRIQSQHAVFLDYPFDAGFERHTFGFDRIVFPTERDPSVLARLIPVEDIYPTQKSDLEVLLDQFFMLEKMEEGSKAVQEAARAGHIVIHRQESVPDGIEAECFGPTGLPLHESWESPRLDAWLRPQDEDWQPVSQAPSVSLPCPSASPSQKGIRILQREIDEGILSQRELRACPLRWTVHGLSDSSGRIARALELVWDGLRRWPYDSNEIAEALATVVEFGRLVAESPDALHQPQLARSLAEQCIGEAIEVEIGMEDSSYTRGYASKKLLREAVRDDFFTFLTDVWRPQIKDVRHILQIAFNPRRTFSFDRLKSVFCKQIVPTQVILRGEGSGKARLFNAARATAIGLP